MRIRASERWRDNWRVVAPAGAATIHVPRRGRQAGTEGVARLPAGTPVVLVAPGVGAARRCDAFVAEHGIEIGREYLAFPSAEAPAYLVEDDAGPARLFSRTVLAAPPGAPLVLRAGISLLRKLPARASLRALAPGRLVVGTTR
jgi:hypothetical protein